MPRTVVETLAMPVKTKRTHLLPILPEDDEPRKRTYDPTKIITRKNGVQYRLGLQLTHEEKLKQQKERKAKWLAKPGVAEEQKRKAKLRQQRLVERRQASFSATTSISSQVSKMTPATGVELKK